MHPGPPLFKQIKFRNPLGRAPDGRAGIQTGKKEPCGYLERKNDFETYGLEARRLVREIYLFEQRWARMQDFLIPNLQLMRNFKP